MSTHDLNEVCTKCGHDWTPIDIAHDDKNPALIVVTFECKSCGHKATHKVDKWSRKRHAPPDATA